jgi:ankyrin repeat protein
MDVPEPNAEDVEAIIDAAYNGDMEEVRSLVEQDRRLLEADNGDDTPLTAAAWSGRVEVIRYLLDEGAEVNLRSSEGASALDAACDRGHLEAVSLLLAHGADAAAAWGEGETPLMSASANGHTDVVALLLVHGCGDINRQRADNDQTALHDACAWVHVGLVRALLGAGADPHVVDLHGYTPQEMAITLGCVALLQVRAVLVEAQYP